MIVKAAVGGPKQGVLELPGLEPSIPSVERNRLGAVYTPPPIANWLAHEVVRRLPRATKRRVLDPACGDGALLAAVASEDPDIDLSGLDIDVEAATAARFRLGNARITQSDALTGSWDSLRESGSGIIANPPWGAELLHSREELVSAGYSLACGQFDSYELFVERAIDQLPEGGVAGFLLPDSLLLPEHAALRSLLLNRTRIELLVRLGEGIFEGVYRGTVAVVFIAEPPAAEHVVRCCRVRDTDRRRILAGTTSLADVVLRHGHDVKQAHFARNNFAIDVDVAEEERETFARISAGQTVWTPWLHAYRGVEIGKGGLVTLCAGCGQARPVRRPSGPARCGSCGQDGAGQETISIIRPLSDREDQPDWRPVLAGEDVQRYAIKSRREIRLDVPGVRYKDSAIFGPPKLLVRKTGVGLHAALDSSGSYTTQTVYHFLPNAVAPAFALRYVLGVLNSRIMLAYHLKRHGELEWRSHPYVTPKMLTTLPVPLPLRGTQGWRQASAIAEAVSALELAPPQERHGHDLRVERLVAALFDFSAEECGWVDNVLGEAQQLQAISALRLMPHDELYPLKAA